MPEHVKQELVLKDEILQRIFSIKTNKKSTAIVSRYEFHEMLLDADDNAPTDAAPLPDAAAAPCGKSAKAVRPKQSPLTATPSKLRTTQSPSKPPGGRRIPPPALSKSPGDPESPKRGAPFVRTPPARSAKQAKTAPSLPPGHRKLNFAPDSTTKATATSRKAASDVRDAAEPPRKKHARLSSESVGTHRTKVVEVSSEVATKSKRRSRAAATVPPANAPEQEVIDLCDSD
jgi:hypothetical protein